MTSLPPRIGRFEIRSLIGQGGMGMLYLAWDPQLERNVAIKVLLQDDEQLRARFLREARSAARLQHPRIITVFDVGLDEGRPFIAMEYIPGFTLATVIEERREVSVAQKLAWIEQLCDGLGYAHAGGIIHRDIKPANLMIDGSGSLQILDFGIARVLYSGDLTQTGAVLGTLNYMSPEQLSGQEIDHRSDIHGVGAVLYELLTYRQAFPGAMADGVLGVILQTEPPPLSSLIPTIDPRIATVVERALRKDPSERYQDLATMKEDLAIARRGLGTPFVHSPTPRTPFSATMLVRAGTEAPRSPPPGPAADSAASTASPAASPSTPSPTPAPRTSPPWRWIALFAVLVVSVPTAYVLVAGDGGAEPGPSRIDSAAPSDDPMTPEAPLATGDSATRGEADTLDVTTTEGEAPNAPEAPDSTPEPTVPVRAPPECEQLLIKQSLGEPLTDAETRFLTQRCRT